jgi:putative membrane protein
MKSGIVHLLLSAAVLLVVAHLVGGFHIANYGFAILTALVLGFVNSIIRPIMVILTLPLTIVTFGLFLFVVNALMLKLAAGLLPGVVVTGLWPAIVAALLISILNMVVFAVAPAQD